MLVDAETMSSLLVLKIEMPFPFGSQGFVHQYLMVVIHHRIVLAVQQEHGRLDILGTSF